MEETHMSRRNAEIPEHAAARRKKILALRTPKIKARAARADPT